MFNNIEYFFGAGVQTSRPGHTHHGRPIEIIPLGTTQLPLDIINEYLASLKEIYTPQSYDLFAHNCNNFANDFATFLVGRGIPDHITSLPRRVLETPFAQMLRPQLDASMRAITQSPVPEEGAPAPAAANGTGGAGRRTAAGAREAAANGPLIMSKEARYGSVVHVGSLADLNRRVSDAADTASTIFFTSSTCAPCRIAYPTYDSLAEEYGDALFVKVDINAAHDAAARYGIRATPTFMTFSRSAKLDEWSGADPNLLRSNVERLIRETWPPHPHTLLNVPSLAYGSLKPVTYSKIPPLDKLMTKLGSSAQDPSITALRSFVETRNKDAREATLPDLKAIAATFESKVLALPLDVRYAAIDLLRCAMLDPRVSSYFAEDASSTVPAILQHVLDLGETCPHNLRLVTVHLACNIFTSSLYIREIFRGDEQAVLPQIVVQLIATSLLDATHASVRVAAAWLGFNVAGSMYRIRREDSREALSEGLQVGLAAGMLEVLPTEENEEAVKAILLTMGYLVFCAPRESELVDLCQALDAAATLRGLKAKGQEKLVKEVASLL